MAKCKIQPPVYPEASTPEVAPPSTPGPKLSAPRLGNKGSNTAALKTPVTRLRIMPSVAATPAVVPSPSSKTARVIKKPVTRMESKSIGNAPGAVPKSPFEFAHKLKLPSEIAKKPKVPSKLPILDFSFPELRRYQLTKVTIDLPTFRQSFSKFVHNIPYQNFCTIVPNWNTKKSPPGRFQVDAAYVQTLLEKCDNANGLEEVVADMVINSPAVGSKGKKGSAGERRMDELNMALEERIGPEVEIFWKRMGQVTVAKALNDEDYWEASKDEMTPEEALAGMRNLVAMKRAAGLRLMFVQGDGTGKGYQEWK